MRLTKKEVEDIIQSLDSFLLGHQAELYLFGSRVHDHLKGGDIDLLLLVENPAFKKELKSGKHRILAALKNRLGDRKIDFHIFLKDETNQDPFLISISDSLKLLFTWVH